MTNGPPRPPRTPPGAPGGGMSMVQPHPVHPGFAEQVPPRPQKSADDKGTEPKPQDKPK